MNNEFLHKNQLIKSWKNNPYILMLILLLFWGSMAAVNKQVLQQLDSYQVMFWFFGIAWFVMTIIMLIKKKIFMFNLISSHNWLLLILASLAHFLYYFFFSLSLSIIPAFEASMLNYMFPIFIVLLAIPMNGEKLNVLKAFSLIVSFIGVVILITAGTNERFQFTNIFGDLLALGAAFCWAFFSNLTKKIKCDHIIGCYTYTSVGFILSTIIMMLFSQILLPSWVGIGGIFWMSFSNLLMTYLLWLKVIQASSMALAANLAFMTPFITLLFIVVLLGEPIGIIQLLGASIILLGTFLQLPTVVLKTKKLYILIRTTKNKNS